MKYYMVDLNHYHQAFLKEGTDYEEGTDWTRLWNNGTLMVVGHARNLVGQTAREAWEKAAEHQKQLVKAWHERATDEAAQLEVCLLNLAFPLLTRGVHRGRNTIRRPGS